METTTDSYRKYQKKMIALTSFPETCDKAYEDFDLLYRMYAENNPKSLLEKLLKMEINKHFNEDTKEQKNLIEALKIHKYFPEHSREEPDLSF